MTQLSPASSDKPQSPSFFNSSHGIKSWLFTLDHKRIGIMYLVFVLAAFLLGGIFALLVDPTANLGLPRHQIRKLAPELEAALA